MGDFKTRTLRLEELTIPYHWGFDIAEHLTELTAGLGADRFIVVTDNIVGPLYAERFTRPLESLAPVTVEIVDSGESAKSWQNLSRLCERFVKAGATRKTCVVALGGGVVGNLAGLASALTFRGLRLIQVPTTMMGAFDSVLSLKQAINSTAGKNHFGAFHAPLMIFGDLAVLSTLPEREILSGIGEVIKNVLAIRPQAFNDLAERIRPIRRRDAESLCWFLNLSIESKMELMESDAKEQRRAVLFEYGHTIGHAVEFLDTLNRGRHGLSHGEAVALGTLVASEVSRDVLGCGADLVDAHRYLLGLAGICDKLPISTEIKGVMTILKRDNKRGYISCSQDETPMILLRGLGEPNCCGSHPLTPVHLNVLESALSRVQGVPARTYA